jgi:hypothetical protein
MGYRHALARVAAAVGLVGTGTALVGIAATPAGAATAPSPGQLSSNFALAVGPSAQLAALSEPGCHLGNGVQHVFYIGFDNFHLRRDNSNSVANNGDDNHNTDANIPSDLEQVPALYNFLKGNGTVLTNNHTPLIAHTSVDFTAAYSGVYGDQNGIATTQNNIAAYNGSPYTGGTTSAAQAITSRSNGAFGFWTDPLAIGTDSTPQYLTKNQSSNVVNAPAPWVPFTRAGCDVGAVAATTMVLENQNSVNDVNAVTPGAPFTTSDEGLAVHCAAGTNGSPGGLCSLAGNFGGTDAGVTAAPDDLPSEPGAPYNSANGYYALFGHRFIAPAINDRLQGLGSGGSTTLGLLRAPSATGFSTSFNGDDGNYTLGYVLAMQEAGVPVTFGYLTTAHNCYTALDGAAQSTFLTSAYDDYNPGGTVPATNPCNHTDAPGTTDSGTSSSFGSGEQGYVNYLAQLNSDFSAFFNKAQTDGYTPANSVFVFYSDENDHVSEGTPAKTAPTDPDCNGMSLTPGVNSIACQYNHSATQTTPTAGQLGEVTVKLDNTFPEGGATSYSVLADSAPDFYVEEQGSAGPPSQTDPNVRAFERSVGSYMYTDPYTGASTNLATYEADQAGMNAVHMITQDPNRAPTFDVFAPGEDFVEYAGSFNGSDCGGTANTTCSNAGFPYVHGDFAPETDTTWAGLVAPGVANLGTSSVWTDHTDLRTTVLALTGLQDDYTDAGRVITEILTRGAVSGALTTQTATDLGTLLKKLNAPVYMSSEGANDGFGPAILVADTSAVKSNAPNDSTYTDVEGKIVNITAQRNTVVADIQARLAGAQDGAPIDQAGAVADENYGACILTYANQLKTYAANPMAANAPTDCGTPSVLPETSHTALFIVGAGVLCAGALLLGGRHRRMRHRLS